MAKLSGLKMKKEEKFELPEEGSVPRQFGESRPSLYPGKYGFQLPTNVNDVWDVIPEATVKDKKVERIQAVFDEAHPLTILMAPNSEAHVVGTNLDIRISNVERPRDKDKTKYVSDMYYLLVEGLGLEETKLRAALKVAVDKKTNANVVWAQLLEQFADATFGAWNEWSAYCNPKKQRYVMGAEGTDDEGKTILDPEGAEAVGCDTRTYQKDIPVVEGRFQERFVCPGCDVAIVRAFPNLTRFFRWAPTEG